MPSDDKEDEANRAWSALRLRVRSPMWATLRGYTEVSEYDGAERILLHPSQLYSDDFGRPIPRSRMKKIVDEWCEFFEAGNTPIRHLEIRRERPSGSPRGCAEMTQLRAVQIKWGDYEDTTALALKLDLRIAELKERRL